MSIFTVEADPDFSKLPEKCIGHFFRCLRNGFVSAQDGTYNFQIKFRPLKSLSCTGCQQCMFLDDTDDILFMFEKFTDGGIVDHVMKAVPGSIYQVEITNVSTDWETGYVDDYDLEFVPVNRETVKKGNHLSWKTED